MKKRMLALILCLALPLSGCAAMLERSHVTSTDHVDYAIEEDESILRAESYQGLVNSMLYFVHGHRSGGTVRLYNYAGDVDADLAAARAAVLDDPVGAYAVRVLSYKSTRILTYYEVDLSILYTHSAEELSAIPEVNGLAGVRQELTRLVEEQRDSAVFLASYFSGGRELVEQLLLLACFSAPELFRHHDISITTVSLYPETGTRRMVEVKLGWSVGTEQVAQEERDYARQLETAAAALLEANPPKGEEGYTVEELAAIVRAANGGYDWYGAREALGALSGEPAQTIGVLLAMEYLCRQCGIEVMPVFGEGDEWLIVATPDGYRHLLVESLYRESPLLVGEDGEAPEPSENPDPDKDPDEDGEPEGFTRLYTDEELRALVSGDYQWEWDTSLYPPCVEGGVAAYAEGSAEPW